MRHFGNLKILFAVSIFGFALSGGLNAFATSPAPGDVCDIRNYEKSIEDAEYILMGKLEEFSSEKPWARFRVKAVFKGKVFPKDLIYAFAEPKPKPFEAHAAGVGWNEIGDNILFVSKAIKNKNGKKYILEDKCFGRMKLSTNGSDNLSSLFKLILK